MKKTLFFFVLLFVSFYTFAHPVRLTASYFGGTGNEILHDVAFADDGTLVIVGTTDNTGSLNIPAGIPTNILGTDNPASVESAYILRFTNNGQQLLSFSRFATGSIKIKDLRLAVTENGIYIVAVGYNAFAQLPGFDGKIDNVPGSKPVIVRVSLDGSQILNATYLGGGDSDRDVNDIDVFPNTDLCVSHDKNGAGADYISRVKPDLSGFVWTRTFAVWCGSARTNAMAVSPQGDRVYVGGYGMGHTGLEPYKDPYLFCFSGDGQMQYWKRGTADNDYGVFNFPQASIGANRLISDSQINALSTDSVGNVLPVGYSDGGSTVFQYEPWLGGYNSTLGAALPAGISDGDSFAGFSGATSVSTIGLMDKNGEWIRMHAIKPYNTWNRWYGVTRGFNNSVFYTGRTSGIPDVYSWESGGANGVLMKVVYDPAKGTQRKFVTHPAGVDAMNKVARDRNTYRYAAIGTANSAKVYAVNAFQPAYGGSNDGYILVFDDNDKPVISDSIPVMADAQIMWGANADKNYGSTSTLKVHRRDSRSYDTSKSYMKFDLRGITKPVIDARIIFYKSGKYDNGEAIIYALKSGNDTWTEPVITWNNAPGNITDSPWRINPLLSDSLGILTIPKTNSPATISYQGPVLTNYISSCHQNGQPYVTFVFATSTKYTDTNDPIFSAASKESAGLLKPYLQIKYDKEASVAQNMRFWPENVKLMPGESRKFYANLFDQYGSVMDKPVNFSVNNGASVSQDGVFQASTPGVYTITAQSEGFTATTTVTIDASTLLEDVKNADIQVLVNDKTLTVLSVDKQQFEVKIFDLNGKLIQSVQKCSNQSAIHLNYPAGVYVVQIITTHDSYTKKIVLE